MACSDHGQTSGGSKMACSGRGKRGGVRAFPSVSGSGWDDGVEKKRLPGQDDMFGW